MKKTLLLTILALLSFSAVASAAVTGDIGVTYSSKYIWRGFDVYSDKSAIHPFINLKFGDSGFGMNLVAHRANSDGFENTERWDYNIFYRNAAFAGERYQMNYQLGYCYFNYPDMTSHKTSSFDIQEFNGIFSFPNILGIERLVPTYVIVKLSPVNSGSLKNGGTASGFAHIFILDYGIPITCPITDKEQMINLHSEFVYNDGVSPIGTNIDHDWSNAVFGISTTYKLSENVSFTPALNHQITFEDDVNGDKDETWVSLTIKYAF